MKNSLTVMLLGIVLASISASAQNSAPPAAGRQGGAGPQGGLPAGMANPNAPQGIDEATAKRIAETAQAAAVAAGARVAIAVVDMNSDLVHFIRMDGAATRAVGASQGKARAVVLFGMPSKAIADAIAAGRPLSTTVTPTGTQGIDLWTVQGGLPIVRNGRIVAAIGVGGGAGSAQDEQFAQAAIDAFEARR